MEQGQHDNFEVKDDNINAENWQRSLEISTPVDLPTPEKLAAAAEAIYSNQGQGPIYSGPNDVNIAPDATPDILTPAPANTEKSPSPENAPFAPFTPDMQPAEPVLGQISPIASAPSYQSDNTTYNPANIKTTGDKLEKSSIAEVDNAIAALGQTGNLSDFYDQIRGMTETNLNNSFNRKLGENSLGGPEVSSGTTPGTNPNFSANNASGVKNGGVV